jgi:hypothetical protein
MLQNFDDMQRLAKVNMDATTKSLDVMAKNVQTIATEMTNYSKRSLENGSKTLEKLLGAKSLDKAIEVQSEYAKVTYEDYVAQATKIGQLYVDLGTEAFKPYEGLNAKAPTK